jgi:hypothetical protein
VRVSRAPLPSPQPSPASGRGSKNSRRLVAHLRHPQRHIARARFFSLSLRERAGVRVSRAPLPSPRPSPASGRGSKSCAPAPPATPHCDAPTFTLWTPEIRSPGLGRRRRRDAGGAAQARPAARALTLPVFLPLPPGEGARINAQAASCAPAPPATPHCGPRPSRSGRPRSNRPARAGPCRSWKYAPPRRPRWPPRCAPAGSSTANRPA